MMDDDKKTPADRGTPIDGQSPVADSPSDQKPPEKHPGEQKDRHKVVKG
jgi:hypothetical protein